MNYVIGDIHGEISKLRKLMTLILSTNVNPQFTFVGDYVDKGEDSKSTLEFLLELSKSYKCTFLLGNHEFVWKEYALTNDKSSMEYLIKFGGSRTANSFGRSVEVTAQILLKEYPQFFLTANNYQVVREYIVCHSGISPCQFHVHPEDIEAKDFLFNRYDFISQQSLFLGKFKVIFGHTGFYSPYVDEFKVGIDTSACYLEDQPLTALCVDEEKFYNSLGQVLDLKTMRTETCPNIVRAKPFRT